MSAALSLAILPFNLPIIDLFVPNFAQQSSPQAFQHIRVAVFEPQSFATYLLLPPFQLCLEIMSP